MEIEGVLANQRLGVYWIVASAFFAVQNPPRIEVDVPLVIVDVAVTDSKGNGVANLRKEDFVVYDNGVSQPISYFDTIDSPRSVLVLVDELAFSPYRSWPLESEISLLVGNLREIDEISIAQFGVAVSRNTSYIAAVTAWQTVDKSLLDSMPASFREKLSVALGKETSDRVPLYAAVKWALAEMAGRNGRKTVVIVTAATLRPGIQYPEITVSTPVGGGRRIADAPDDKDFQRILRDVRTSNVRVSFIALDTDLNPGIQATFWEGGILRCLMAASQMAIRSRLQLLSNASGGLLEFPIAVEDIAPIFLQIGKSLGSSYSLGFMPKETRDGQHHRITVTVQDSSYSVKQSRAGYEDVRFLKE